METYQGNDAKIQIKRTSQKRKSFLQVEQVKSATFEIAFFIHKITK